jgi:uncharacterized protein YyaL (SSP411 family)
MAHESFEDPQVARLMNETFVNVKLDREERPDVDQVYMDVCQMMTGGGGWPLTIVMTPDRQPFFAATYIPRQSAFGRPGMLDLVPRIGEMWAEQRGQLLDNARRITSALRGGQVQRPGEAPGAEVMEQAYRQLARRFDPTHGGFGTAPKFPTPHMFIFLLRRFRRHDDAEALQMVEKSLSAMRDGGIFDQLGFGFHRYSTDERWLVPHFEKMLYDQALLVLAYLETYQATGAARYADTAREVLTYVLRDLAAPDGGFYSAEDADSEGEEGKFYLWTEAQIRELLPADQAELALSVWGVDGAGNFLEEASGRRTGANILHRRLPLSAVAERQGLSPERARELLEQARATLLEQRGGRVRPGLDDKLLTDWNGLMIAALARAGAVLDDEAYRESATGAAEFVLQRMRADDGRLLHRFRAGEAAIAGMLDDYAFVVWGLLELYEASFEVRWLEAARELNGLMLERFWDDEHGGLFLTPDDGEELLVRQKTIYDGALPSGNSVASLNLLRLARIGGDPGLERRAEAIGRLFASQVDRVPSAFTQLLVSLDFALGPTSELVLAGDSGAPETWQMLRALQRPFEPRKVVLLRPTEEPEPAITAIAPATLGQTGVDGAPTAYVCRDYACQRPTTDVAEALELLRDQG